MIRIAVTGGIACGKSLAAGFMRAAGVAVCEADAVAHALMEPGSAVYEGILHAFGRAVLQEDGSINRRHLGGMVFKDDARRATLNALVHPAVGMEIARWLKQERASGATMAAAVIPLLFEADMAEGWDAVVCVACAPAAQMTRLRARGLDEDECRMRLRAQMPLEEKIERSDFTIWNDGSPEELSAAVRRTIRAIEEKYA